MDRYIGLDAHASSCTLGVLGPGGKRLGSHVLETNARTLIEMLCSIPGPQHLKVLIKGSRAGLALTFTAPSRSTGVNQSRAANLAGSEWRRRC